MRTKLEVKIDNVWRKVECLRAFMVGDKYCLSHVVPNLVEDVRLNGRALLDNLDQASWISVDDEYPNNMRNVLILTDGGRIFTAYYLEDAEVWLSPYEDDKEYKHVTHWHELPKPPKTE